MGQIKQITKPQFLNTAKSPKYLAGEESFYLLNNSINKKTGLSTPEGGNFAVCELELPIGSNVNNNSSFYSPLTQETYFWTYNSNGVNFISRINSVGECEVVYDGCLSLNPSPEHAINGKMRAYMKVDRFCNKIPGGELKQLVWVNGIDEIGMLDVEASIATDSFRTPFFESDCYDPCDLWRMFVPNPKGCLVGEWGSTGEYDKNNEMSDRGFKFMFQHEYYDKRKSEWSDISSFYFQSSKECFDGESGGSNYLRFNIPYGSPMVERVLLAVSEDGGTNFLLYDTIEKYKQDGRYWYEKVFDETLILDEVNCTLQYDFKNDKLKIPLVSQEDATRVFNPHPRKVQALLPMANKTLGFVNYEKGVCPVDLAEIKKISVSADCKETNDCKDEVIEIKVKAVIYSFYFKNHGYAPIGYIYRTGAAAGAADDKTDPAMFSLDFSDTPTYDQRFNGELRDFVAYIEGTSTKVEMEQWKRTGSNNKNAIKIGVVAKKGDLYGNLKGYNNTVLYYQEGSLFVKKGTKGFIRLASHLISSLNESIDDTSTQVKGIFKFGTGAFFGGNLPDYRDAVYEIPFDTCNVTGSVLELEDAFVVEDLYTKGASPISSGFDGYIRDKDGLPVEGARIFANSQYQTITDHNGFYSFYNYDGDSLLTLDVYVELDCGAFRSVGSFPSNSGSQQVGHTDYVIDSDIYNSGFSQQVNLKIKDCDGNPVPSVRVAVSGGKYKVTGNDGIATFRLRNYYTRNRKAQFIFMDKSVCITKDCDGNCNPCMPDVTLSLPACFETSLPMASELSINTASIFGKNRGLKKGGRYPIGVVAEGDFGRLSAVYFIGYLDIPKSQVSGNTGFCDTIFSIDTSIKLPDWVTNIKIVRGENLSDFVLQWVVDDISRTSDGKLNLTIQSLNDYNELYNFNTNTSYKFADGDRIEFIKDGDGNFYGSVINQKILSPYNDTVTTPESDFFNQILTQDSPELQNLKKGAIIEITRNRDYNEYQAYFEICFSIPVTNGTPVIYGGTFDTFDTHIVRRTIGGRPYISFEHKYPTDFYKGIADDRGKVHFANKYENESRVGRNIIINAAEQFNYFTSTLEKTFDVSEQGDIIAINLKDEKIGLAISQNGNSTFEASSDLLKVGSDGAVRAASAKEIISNLSPKIRGDFGLNYDDVGSVYFGDGYVTWIDSKKSKYVVHDYKEAKEVASKAGIGDCSNHFDRIIAFKRESNLQTNDPLEKYRWATGFNQEDGNVYLTLKNLNQAGVNNIIYLELPDSTIKYNALLDKLTGFSSISPESYSQYQGSSFIAFQNATPYLHSILPDTWNEFFGIPCDWIVGATFNIEPTKIKTPLNIELQSDTMFFAKKITTGSNSISEIPAIRWNKNIENKWNAAFLNNINSRGGLYEGDTLKSYYINVLFIRDNTLNLKYNSKDETKMIQYSELDMIIFKGKTVEQSGFK